MLLLRRSMIDAIGAFDERFFMFFEETDLCRRARQAGWSVWSIASTAYAHDGGQSLRLRDDREKLWAASGRAYFRKHGGALQAVLFSVQNYVIRRCLLRSRRAAAQALRQWANRGPRDDVRSPKVWET